MIKDAKWWKEYREKIKQRTTDPKAKEKEAFGLEYFGTPTQRGLVAEAPLVRSEPKVKLHPALTSTLFLSYYTNPGAIKEELEEFEKSYEVSVVS